MHDGAVRVVGHQRLRKLPAVAEAAREVVLDDESTRRVGDLGDPTPAFGGEHRARRVVEQRLAVEDPGAGGGEGVLQQIQAHAVVVHGHRDRAQPRGPGGGQHTGIGRRLDEHRGPRRGERVQGGGRARPDRPR